MITLCTPKIAIYIFFLLFFCPLYKNDEFIINELKLILKIINIKDYKIKSENDLIKILSEPKPKISLSKKKVKDIKKDFSELRCGFSTSKTNEFTRSLYNIKNQTIFPHQK